jgi:cytoskeletal protein CcmA (bactofilin family)
MWRKTNDVKPSSQPAAAPLPAPMRSEEPKPWSPAIPTQVTQAASAPVPEPPRAPAPTPSSVSKISAGLKIQGEISGSADLYIDGDVQGKIRVSGASVTVGPNGRVQAEIDARQISVQGSVQGNLKASENSHFGASSKFVGSVSSPRIGIDDGAHLRGKVETVRSAAKPEKSTTPEPAEAENLHPATIGADSE